MLLRNLKIFANKSEVIFRIKGFANQEMSTSFAMLMLYEIGNIEVNSFKTGTFQASFSNHKPRAYRPNNTLRGVRICRVSRTPVWPRRVKGHR